MRFIIEHLEPKLYDWCLIEYWHISKIVGEESTIFTNIDKKNIKKLQKYGTVYEKNISELNFGKICILSQYSRKKLTTKDKNKFQFGSVYDLSALLIKNLKKSKIKFETRNLGNKQMPTDAAVYVAKKILDGMK